MKLLMENWRKFNEATEPVLGRTEIEDIITDKFSFNSLQGPDHRFTLGQPVVDYNFDEQMGEWKFIAWVSSDPKKAKETPDFEIEEGETLEAFLTRVKEAPRQPNLGLE